MESAPPVSVWGVVTDFIVERPSPQQILAYQIPNEYLARLDELLLRVGKEELTREEIEELISIVRADDLICSMQTKIRAKLRQK